MQEVDALVRSALDNTKISADVASDYLSSIGEDVVTENTGLATLARRPTVDIGILLDHAGALPTSLLQEHPDALHRVQTSIRYAGYIEKQERDVERFREYESKQIPLGLDYGNIKSLSTEAREKLSKIQPASLGQASRIPGVSASDVSILAVYLR